jgi:putative flippase GtrA
MLKKLLDKHSDKIRFILVGGTNTAIDITILFGLKALGLPTIPSNFISTSIALVFSYFANKKFTFKDNVSKDKTQFVKFLGITLFGLWAIQPTIIWIIGLILQNLDLNTYVVLFIGKIIATCATLVWNYLLYRKFVYKIQK